MAGPRPRSFAGIAIAFACGLWGGSAVHAQEMVAVTVADSPVAWQLYQQALDHAKENPSEAARLCQRLLDGFADRVIPADDPAADRSNDRFESVLERVERFLREHRAALERYRQIEGPEAERLAATESPETIARTHGMTRPGLRAHLTLAERDLLAGSFENVLARLERVAGHPDLSSEGREAVAYWYLRGAAAALGGHGVEREEAIARLTALGAEATTETEALAKLSTIEAATAAITTSVLGPGEAPPASDDAVGWQPIWSIPLLGTPFARYFLGAAPPQPRIDPFNPNVFQMDDPSAFPQQHDKARYDGTMLCVAPSVAGDAVIVSDGTTLYSFDRLSHRTIWSVPIGTSGIARDGGVGEDLACVAIGEGHVVAYSRSTAMTMMERSDVGQVSCVNLDSGALRWQARLSLLDVTGAAAIAARAENGDIFDGMFPSGEPVIDGGTVYVLARKLTPQLETVEYMLGFDLQSGTLKFATYLCSSSGMPRVSSRPDSCPVVAFGSVFVASTVGTVARVDATDGHVRWVHRSMVPMRELRYQCEPWEIGGPALVGDSLFVISPDQSEVVQYEAASGRRVRAFPTGTGSAWGTPRYLLPDARTDLADGVRGPRVYAVGADVVAIDAENPTRALWTLSKSNETLFASREGVANRSGIRGRVQVAGGLLVVPGLRDVLLVRRDTGRVRSRIECEGPANPLLVGPQLFLGQNASLTTLMPTSSAERVMRARIAATPTDPEGGLALLDLGLRTKRLDLCADAAAAARAALNKSQPEEHRQARGELVERLLRTMKLEEAAGDGGDNVLTILKDVARTPSQRVRHLLARSEWLAQRKRYDDAMTALDAVLADAGLASVTVDDDDWIRPAATLAAERLAALALEAPTVFAAREAAARAQLDAAGEDIEKLRTLVSASSATGSVAAIEAATRLARALDKADRPLAALAVATQALRAVPDQAPGATSIIEAIIEIGEARGWPRWVAALSQAVSRRFPNATARDGRTLAQIVKSQSEPIRLGTKPGEAVEIPGRLVDVAPSAGAQRIDGILVIADHDLMLVDGSTLKAIWTTRIETREPVVLLMGGAIGDAVLLWETRADGSAFASVVSLVDGAVKATTSSLRDALPPEATLAAPRPMLAQMPDGERFEATQVLPFVAGKTLVLVRRNGDAAGFDLGNLAKPAWTATALLGQVYSLTANEFVVAIGGREHGEDLDARPSVVTFDPATGTVLARLVLDEDDEVRWLDLAPTGELTIGSGGGVQAFDALAAFGNGAVSASGAPPTLLWRNESSNPNVRDTVKAWRFGAWLVATDRGDSTAAISLRDGHVDANRFVPPQGDGRNSSLRWAGRLGDSALMQFDDRLVAFTADGTLLGEDALFNEGSEGAFIFLLPTEEGVLAVRTAASRQVPAFGGGMRTEFPYLVYRLSMVEGCRVLGPALQVRLTGPGQRCEQLGALDGILFFSTSSQTIAVPLPLP